MIFHDATRWAGAKRCGSAFECGACGTFSIRKMVDNQ
jgi:hypothetical protein